MASTVSLLERLGDLIPMSVPTVPAPFLRNGARSMWEGLGVFSRLSKPELGQALPCRASVSLSPAVLDSIMRGLVPAPSACYIGSYPLVIRNYG